MEMYFIFKDFLYYNILLTRPGVLKKVLYGEAPPRGPNPYAFIYHFFRKGTPFVYLLLEKGTPFIYLQEDFLSFFHVARNKLK